MKDKTLLGSWVRRFLLEYLVSERNLARNTQLSYRDTLVLLLPFLAKTAKVPIDRLAIEHASPAAVRRFLDHLEKDRGSTVATRNLRLGAIHSLAKFIGSHSPEDLHWCTEIRLIPFKKAAHPMMAYLDKAEMDAVLKAPNQRTNLGARDHALLLFLYNTGARVDEAAHVAVGDFTWSSPSSVRLLGKGNKPRSCPLWPDTVEVLKPLIDGRTSRERVFLNRLGQPLTRFGIYALVQRAVKQASAPMPSLKAKRLGPHSVRHTCAVHQLRSGVDLNTIRAWLGHVSLETTNVYAEVDLEMKAKALARCDIDPQIRRKHWHAKPALMEFLRDL